MSNNSGVSHSKSARLIQPDELMKHAPLMWSPGMGDDVWAMLCASADGDFAAVQQLVEKDPSLVSCAHEYHTPLAMAVRENQLAVAEFLLASGADPINSGTSDTLIQSARDRGYEAMRQLLEARLAVNHAAPGGAAMAAAIRERDLARVRGLLEAEPELVHAADERTNQPIHWAVMTRQPDIIEELLSRGADIDAQRSDGARPIQLTNGDYMYRGWRDVPKDVTTTPADVLAHLKVRGANVDICTAAHTGDIERVRELLDHDPSLANRNSDYVTYYLGSGPPLKNAAATGQLEICRLLLERGADPNLREEGIAPHGHALHSAVVNKHKEVVEMLLEHGAYPSVEIESSADTLSMAISQGDQEMVDLLCSWGAARPVHLLAHYGDIHTAAAVFKANPALANDPGALGSASGNSSDGFIRLMLRYAPDLPKRTATGCATRAMTELLFAHGMNPNHCNWLRVTKLHHFAEDNDVENAAVFIAHGADLDPIDECFQTTPLGWAAKYGKLNMAELLLRHGADPNLPGDPAWATPLAWATSRGHERVASVIAAYQQHGSAPSVYDLEYYQELADALAQAYQSGDAAAMQRLKEHYQRHRSPDHAGLQRSMRHRLGRPLPVPDDDTLPMEDARLLIARAQGFKTWAELAEFAG